MDIEVYTKALEGHMMHQVSILLPVAKFRSKIKCHCSQSPKACMWAEWEIYQMRPRSEPPSLAWAQKLHKALRKFPNSGGLTLKYNYPRAQWGDGGYYNDGAGEYTDWNTGLPYDWVSLEANGGLTVYGEANIPSPAEASDKVTVTLDWYFESPDGEPHYDLVRPPGH